MLSRRDFTRLLTLGGSTALVSQPLLAWPAPLQSTPERPDERFWQSVRDQFLMPPELAVMNAANLCPSPAPVLEAVYRNTKDMDYDPSFENREKMQEGKEATRRLLAQFLPLMRAARIEVRPHGVEVHVEQAERRCAIDHRDKTRSRLDVARLRCGRASSPRRSSRGFEKSMALHLWTHPDPARSASVVTFRPGTLDVRKLAAALYRNDRIGCATRTGTDRPGIRFSPHFYNTMAEVDRAVSAIGKYMRQGV